MLYRVPDRFLTRFDTEYQFLAVFVDYLNGESFYRVIWSDDNLDKLKAYSPHATYITRDEFLSLPQLPF